ncbi:hypothetical protein SL034_000599 [Vibrio harveyi]|nr:hypothetical protein [Vibrio harveyi]
MTNKRHAKHYEKWVNIYNWDTCNTDRELYGKFLLSIITTDKSGSVFNLNGSWGTGKTELLKRLYVEISENRHPVIYIDAWSSDFIKDPLTVISSELLTQLSFILEEHKEVLDNDIKSAFGKLISGIGKIARVGKPVLDLANLASGESIETQGLSHISELINLTSDSIPQGQSALETNSRVINMISQNQLLTDGMDEVRTQVSTISGILEHVYELNIPIIILIDELDRCRPDYAVKVLETVKHFFSVKGCTFLIATDTTELTHSIKAVYGSGFNAEKYLNRFFTNRITLEKPSILNYIKSKEIDFSKYNIEEDFNLTPLFLSNDFYTLFLSSLLSHPELSLRDIDQIIAKIVQSINYCYKYRPKNVKQINFIAISFGVLHHHINQNLFDKHGDARVDVNLFINDNHLNTLLEIFMGLVFTVEVKDIYRGSSIRTFTQPQETLHFMSSSLTNAQHHCIDQLDLRSSIEQALSNYESTEGEGSYWLWSDYKKLINLSGYIN